MGRAPWAGTAAEDADEEAVAGAVVAAEVAEFAARPFLALSGGERARVALARVLAQRTRLPLLTSRPPPWICATRSMSLAAAHADRAAVLHEGVAPHPRTGERIVLPRRDVTSL